MLVGHASICDNLSKSTPRLHSLFSVFFIVRVAWNHWVWIHKKRDPWSRLCRASIYWFGHSCATFIASHSQTVQQSVMLGYLGHYCCVKWLIPLLCRVGVLEQVGWIVYCFVRWIGRSVCTSTLNDTGTLRINPACPSTICLPNGQLLDKVCYLDGVVHGVILGLALVRLVCNTQTSLPDK
jgi:hypothetical protein